MRIPIQINRIQERIELLGAIGRTAEGGVSRFSFTATYNEARELTAHWMQLAGLSTRIDEIGNLIGRLEGLEPRLPPVAMGSHIDTVKNGGIFDGPLGIITAIEIVQAMKDAGIKVRRPLEIIVFVEEEGARFGIGLLGSNAVAGKIHPSKLHKLKDENGVSLTDALIKNGLDPDKVENATISKGYYKAYFELHIEQGSILEKMGISLGLVQGIAGIARLKAIIKGVANHAGSTPMNMRKDALITASRVILKAEQIAKNITGNTVITVGKLFVYPGSMNVIPGAAELYFDIRSATTQSFNQAVAEVKQMIADLCRKDEMISEIEQISYMPPVTLSPELLRIMEEAAASLNVSSHLMYSPAGHDAKNMALITDAALLFVPSQNGISHNPAEYTALPDIETATLVLGEAVLKISQSE